MTKLYIILPLALILCFMVGCQDKEAMAELEEFKARAEVEEQNKELIERYFKELDEYLALAQEQKGDLSFLDKFFAPDYVFHTTLSEIQGFEAFKESVASGPQVWSDLKHVNEDNIADGDIVVWRGYIQATHTGELLGIPASGKQILSPVFYVIRIEDGKMKECWMEWDSLFGLLTAQLGMELKLKN